MKVAETTDPETSLRFEQQLRDPIQKLALNLQAQFLTGLNSHGKHCVELWLANGNLGTFREVLQNSLRTPKQHEEINKKATIKRLNWNGVLLMDIEILRDFLFY